MNLKRIWHAIDASGPQQGTPSRDVIMPPGWYEMERVKNPFGHKAKWLVVKGTLIGATEGFWRDFGKDEEKDWDEFEIVIVDVLPEGAVLVDLDQIVAPAEKPVVSHNIYERQKQLKREERFPTAFECDEITVELLWKPDGKMASAIKICKEVWLNVGGDGDGLGDGTRYLVFHVYNYADSSKASSPFSGCRVNEYKKPYLTYEEARMVAEEHVCDALDSGEWVTFEQMQENSATV